MPKTPIKPIPDCDFLRDAKTTLLSDEWATLTRYEFDFKRSDGSWQRQIRQCYDRGNGATALLYNPVTDCVLLTRQFRLPVFLNSGLKALIETPAGLLEGADPGARMRSELEEETGYRIETLKLLFEAHSSPGSVTESISYYIGTYSEAERVSEGGGEVDEGEDIEVLHMPLETAFQMIGTGEMVDLKTIVLLQHLWINKLTSGDVL